MVRNTLSTRPETHGDEWNRNIEGSSSGMEAAKAEVLWERSVERHRFRYTAILSDGDAKTFKHLCDLQGYGDIELKNASTTSPNDMVLHCESWCLVGIRMEKRMRQPRRQTTWYGTVKAGVFWE